MKTPETMKYKDQKLFLLDQRLLPHKVEYLCCQTSQDVEIAIQEMAVRGAPAIGIAAAYGAALGARCLARDLKNPSKEAFLKEMDENLTRLCSSRPTAVNLMWAIQRMRNLLKEKKGNSPEEIAGFLEKEAVIIHQEDEKINRALGAYGNNIVGNHVTILTHCNAGSIATGGYGTALGVIRSAVEAGKKIAVYADETRPRLQGSRLTAWELQQEGIDVTLIPDSVAATLIRDGKIDLILTGADRIAANGDTANKIGTFMLSVIAKAYQVPFYIAAPLSTVDLETETGEGIVIEERSPSEVTEIEGIVVAPKGIKVYNPAFDVTPADHITGIITEVGIIRKPYGANLKKAVKQNE